MNQIKNIIFDFGGVILPINYHLCAKELKKFGDYDFDAIFSQATQHQVFDGLDTGMLSPAEFRNRLRNLLDSKLTDQQIDQVWNAMLLDYDDSRIELLKKVKQHYKIFLLSNTNQIHYDHFFPIFQQRYGYESMNDLFDHAYLSHEIHLRKPDPEIFKKVLNDQELKAEETLFIDDSIQHVESASKLGICTHFLDLAKGDEVKNLFDQEGVLTKY